MKQKLFKSVIAGAVTYTAHYLIAPALAISSTAATIAQLGDSDAAAYALNVSRSGTGVLSISLLAGLGLALYFIWKKKKQ